MDTHVHRISNRLGWVRTEQPAKTEEGLAKLFPPEYWADVNLALVGFGQTVCEAKKPKCWGCPIRDRCEY